MTYANPMLLVPHTTPAFAVEMNSSVTIFTAREFCVFMNVDDSDDFWQCDTDKQVIDLALAIADTDDEIRVLPIDQEAAAFKRFFSELLG